MRSSSQIRCRYALMSARCEKAWGKAPRVPAGVRFDLLRVQQRAGVGRQLLAQRPGARLTSPISVSARHEARSCRIECTSVMSGLGGAPAALAGVDAGRCRRRTGRGSGRCGGTAGPRSGRPGRGGVGPFAWVPADWGYGGREARRSSIWRASPSARVARRPPGEWRRARRRSGLAGKGKNFSFRGCTRRPMGHPPGPTTCTAVRGAPPLRKKVVSSQRTTKAKARRSHSLPL